MINQKDIDLASIIAKKYNRKVYGSIWIEEWAYLYRTVIENKPLSILEIGSFHHLSSTAFLQGIKDNDMGCLTSLDIKFPEPEFQFGRVPWIKIEQSSFEIMPKMISKYDLIFVDGEHSYQAAKKDILNSLKLINDGGTIIVHDSNYEPVRKAIEETIPNCEMWTHKPDRFHGIAIITIKYEK